MNQDDATAIILRCLREAPDQAAQYGYDAYIPSIIRAHLTVEGVRGLELEQRIPGLTPIFYAAAWDLCRRGILRPGVKRHGAQVTDDGSGGNGYSITPLGVDYLAQGPEATTVPLGPGRFEQMMEPFTDILGAGFQERAGEAIRCY